MVEPGSYIPVNATDVIAILVFPHLAECHTPTFKATVIVPRKDLARQAARLDLNFSYFLENIFRFHKLKFRVQSSEF